MARSNVLSEDLVKKLNPRGDLNWLCGGFVNQNSVGRNKAPVTQAAPSKNSDNMESPMRDPRASTHGSLSRASNGSAKGESLQQFLSRPLTAVETHKRRHRNDFHSDTLRVIRDFSEQPERGTQCYNGSSPGKPLKIQ